MPGTSGSLVRRGWRTSLHIIQVLFASHLFLSYGYEIGPCLGPSMLPTINTAGDFIVVEKWTHLSKRGYKVGDIVQGRHPYENHPVCKRIIGKVPLALGFGSNWEGGDIIRPDISSREVIKVPKGHVWIQGDNLSNSIDSRNYGAVPEATLKGRVLARVIPTVPACLLTS
jgi:inner membrane protease subunit 1